MIKLHVQEHIKSVTIIFPICRFVSGSYFRSLTQAIKYAISRIVNSFIMFRRFLLGASKGITDARYERKIRFDTIKSRMWRNAWP